MERKFELEEISTYLSTFTKFVVEKKEEEAKRFLSPDEKGEIAFQFYSGMIAVITQKSKQVGLSHLMEKLFKDMLTYLEKDELDLHKTT